MPLNEKEAARIAEINANYHGYNNGDLMRAVRRLLTIIIRLAAERPEVVRAEWIEYTAPWGGSPGEYKCSGCNWTGDSLCYDYCPNCGARMDADAPERAWKDGRDG